MSKMTQAVKENRTNSVKRPVVNFMGGISYELNPLDTMKMVTASSIFGEPQYYRDGEFAEKTIHDAVFKVDSCFCDYELLDLDTFNGKKTSDVMEIVIDEALQYDFGATLEWAKVLRKEYLMRLNPQVIMVRAALMTEQRTAFTEKNPGSFQDINFEVMSRADDVVAQVTYYLYIKGGKKGIPGILKRSWAKKLESLSAYELYKYRNKGIGLVDTVRICHANNAMINELMQTGTVTVSENQKTWETYRATGDDWSTILTKIRMPHMALLRNLRGIFSEIADETTVNELMTQLKDGVARGKQFPFRYMNAYNAVKHADISANKTTVLDGLEDCLDAACENLPKLHGKSAFLSDNSGSAWGTCNSEYGTVTIAEIGNLSSVIGAVNSDEGTVFTFGDRLIENTISKRNGILTQANEISKKARHEVGGSTENGIWLFFKDIIENEKHYDNIFIYSDQQAGHGGLFGTDAGIAEYTKAGYATCSRYVDVAKLIDAYRNKVNPKVNVYCIQTAGYNNVLVPENGYRTNILYGWTGKELVYADAMNKFWDELDSRNNN